MCCIRVAAYLTAWRDAGLERAVDHAITVSGSGGALGAYLSGLSHRAVACLSTWRCRVRVGTPGTGGGSVWPNSAMCCAACTARWLSSGPHPRPPHDLARGGHAAVRRELPARCQAARPDAAQAVLASSAFPHMTAPIRVGVGETEENLVDGACGMPLPILAGVKRFRPDTLIVLASRPHPKHLPWLEQWVWPMFARTRCATCRRLCASSAAAMRGAMAAEADGSSASNAFAGAASRPTGPRSPSSRGPPTSSCCAGPPTKPRSSCATR